MTGQAELSFLFRTLKAPAAARALPFDDTRPASFRCRCCASGGGA